MEQLVTALMSIAILVAILYAIVRALARVVLTPIHTKLDRLLELQERSLTPESAGPSSPRAGDDSPR